MAKPWFPAPALQISPRNTLPEEEGTKGGIRIVLRGHPSLQPELVLPWCEHLGKDQGRAQGKAERRQKGSLKALEAQLGNEAVEVGVKERGQGLSNCRGAEC